MKQDRPVTDHEISPILPGTRFDRAIGATTAISACIVLSLGLGLLGCTAGAPPPAVDTSTSALTCEPFDDSYCDPASYCDVGTQYVQCSDGIIMFAWMTPDCRWCINRDVCDGHGGPTVCPF